jgi:hypothetical protein
MFWLANACLRAKQRLAVSMGALAVLACTLAVAPAARAASYPWCSSCSILNGTYQQDPSAFNLTLVYGHYLGVGDRLMGASAVGFAWIQGTNEVSHGFDGSHHTSGQVENISGYSYITVNAHVDY